MKTGFAISGGAHAVFLLIAAFGLPWLDPHEQKQETVTTVELIDASEFNQPPPSAPEVAPDIAMTEFETMEIPSFEDEFDVEVAEADVAPEETVQDYVEDPSEQDKAADLSALLEALAQPEVAVDVGEIEEVADTQIATNMPATSIPSAPRAPSRPTPSLPGASSSNAPPRSPGLPPPPKESSPKIDTSSDTPKEEDPVEEQPEETPVAEEQPEETPEEVVEDQPEEPTPEELEAQQLASVRPRVKPRDFEKVVSAQEQIAAVMAEAARIKAEQEAAAAAEAEAAQQAEQETADAEAKAIADALKQAEAEAEAQAAAAAARDVPLGPPINSVDSSAFFARIADCWVFDPGTANANQIVFTLRFALEPDGSVVGGSVEVVEPSDWRKPGLEQAVTSAIRAVNRCGNKNMILPAESYGRWQNAQLTFDPRRKALSW
ncbi:hypothetical protein [Algicella marina]|uniref:Cell envelope integrity protein TolA n=1 Tax=Algicella marina TaxID=2683284 RepID=A0A6P1T681_9RHOB|nr:hypothetical protein [Algicella marina]QHQ37213.1 hypothetical protein GO499_19495 [Algicella marina]